MDNLEQAIERIFPLYDKQEYKGHVLQSFQIPKTMDFIRLHYILCFELNTISYEIRSYSDQVSVYKGTNAYLALENFNKIKEQYENT